MPEIFRDVLNQFLDTHGFLYPKSAPDAEVGPYRLSQVMEDPAYLPLVKQPTERGSDPRSPDQALVLAGDPTTGRLRNTARKPYQVAGRWSRKKRQEEVSENLRKVPVTGFSDFEGICYDTCWRSVF